MLNVGHYGVSETQTAKKTSIRRRVQHVQVSPPPQAFKMSDSLALSLSVSVQKHFPSFSFSPSHGYFFSASCAVLSLHLFQSCKLVMGCSTGGLLAKVCAIFNSSSKNSQDLFAFPFRVRGNMLFYTNQHKTYSFM